MNYPPMEPRNYLNEEELQILITALGICVKNGYLILGLGSRSISSSMDKLVCRMPPKVLIRFSTNETRSHEDLKSFLTKVKISDLELEVPGPDVRIGPLTPSRDEFFGDKEMGYSFSMMSTDVQDQFDQKVKAYEALKVPTIIYKNQLEPLGEASSSSKDLDRISLILPSNITDLSVRVTRFDGPSSFVLILPPYLKAFDPHGAFNQVLDLNSNP